MKDLRICKRRATYAIQDYSNNRKQVGSTFKYFKDAKSALKNLTRLSYLKKDFDLNGMSKDMQIKYLKKRLRELLLSVNS